MNGERSWGADTVALGQRSGGKAASVEAETVVLRPAAEAVDAREKRSLARRRPGRRWHLMMAVGMGLVALAALASVVAGGGGGMVARPIGASPARREAVKASTQTRRREPQKVRQRARRHWQENGGSRQLEDERVPKASAATPELTSAPETEPTSVPEMPAEPRPEVVPELPAAPAAPTPAAVEFGM